MEEQAQANPISIDELQTVFEHVKDEYPAEYKMFECDAIALSQLLPALAPALAVWDPLQAPLQWLPVFSAWKRLLSGDAAPTFAQHDGDGGGDAPQGDAFTELCTAALLPPLRRAVMAVWEPRTPLPLLQFFDHWMPVLPPATAAHALRAIVLPRLQAAVNAWVVDGAGPPVHAWLHPWLPHLAADVQHLFPMIRNKLTAMLKVRHLLVPDALGSPDCRCRLCCHGHCLWATANVLLLKRPRRPLEHACPDSRRPAHVCTLWTARPAPCSPQLHSASSHTQPSPPQYQPTEADRPVVGVLQKSVRTH